MVGTGRGAQLGILIRGAEVLERAGRVITVALDKTGTMTTGRMALAGVTAADGVDPGELLGLAASLEDGSEHPVGRAIAEGARDRGLARSPVETFSGLPGRGMAGRVGGRELVVGSAGLLAERGWAVPAEVAAAVGAARAAGHIAVVAGWDGRATGMLAVADQVKPGGRRAVERLAALGLETVLLTGDHPAPARSVAAELGVDEVAAGLLPADKVAEVGRHVAAIPLAATGRLHPMVAAAAMSLSSVFVVACSLQLRAFTPARPAATRVRRLGLAALAVVALAAALALSPRLADPPATAMPATPAGPTTVHLERP